VGTVVGLKKNLIWSPGALLRSNALNLNAQGHVHAESMLLASRDAELVAVEAAYYVRTAQLALEHRVRNAFE